MGIEKRKHKRVFARISVEYRGKNIWQRIEAENVSEGGMFLVTDKIEPQGTPIEIIFKLGKAKNQLIYAEGIVVWVREAASNDSEGNLIPAGMGIHFNKYSPLEAKTFLAREVEGWEDASDT